MCSTLCRQLHNAYLRAMFGFLTTTDDKYEAVVVSYFDETDVLSSIYIKFFRSFSPLGKCLCCKEISLLICSMLWYQRLVLRGCKENFMEIHLYYKLENLVQISNNTVNVNDLTFLEESIWICKWVDDVILSLFCIYFVFKSVKFFFFPPLKLVKACPHIRLYQIKHYFAFIPSGYKVSFTGIFIISVNKIDIY